ncbi:MAG: aromatic ring-hydroxylating dioxygenase subunit alpha [Treponema sp.]|nr:aromatic ring-hydroxylating dioxygenase subunit alpha [Treponema sp.]
MIYNQWYAVLDAREVKKNRLIGVTRFSEKLVFWRNDKNDICCTADKCCHRGASLSCGTIVNGHAACPFHGFEYDKTGKVTYIPAAGKNAVPGEQYRVNSYKAREKYGFIWVWYGAEDAALPEIPFFTDLKDGFTCGQIAETWPVHYTRAIENQLDVVHLPFVHRTTIGRGNKKLVNGPVVKWNRTLMTFYVDNVNDEGQKPLRPDEIPDYEKLFSLQLQMPNIWQNRISPHLRIMAAFAPVDEEHTHIYLRFYQNFVRIPVLRSVVNTAGNIMDRIILHQDRRVVITQLPKKSGYLTDEHLVQGDLPIIEFRKKRNELGIR